MGHSQIPLKSRLKPGLALVAALALNLLGLSGAFAQVAPEDMRPGVRYTTGSYKISGWEHELVKGDPNLAHWNWSAMVGYTQSTGSKRTGKGSTAAPPIIVRSHYVKPTHVTTMVPMQATSRSLVDANGKLVASNVSASLRNSNSQNSVSGQLKRPVALSYGGDYRSSSNSSVGGSIEHRDVYGVITRRGIAN